MSLFLRPEVTVTMMSIDDDSDYHPHHYHHYVDDHHNSNLMNVSLFLRPVVTITMLFVGTSFIVPRYHITVGAGNPVYLFMKIIYFNNQLFV